MHLWIDWLCCIALRWAIVFKKIINFLLERGGYTEDSLATALGRSQSTVNRIKQGQEPRHSDGEKLIELHEGALKTVAVKK